MELEFTREAYDNMHHAYQAEKELRQYYEGKYKSLLSKFRNLLLREVELERAVDQYAHQVDDQNEMIANLLKERREKNWLYQK